ncbi:hypothetical protein GCM10010954_11350 [Halobacillus andaensis]|uniref:Uncharacterized protein n=1 Tax=Halobacillus andaensis TaxID=1176239 RepID=A0A917B1D3_HALAA|nr:hypothetical protein [Halobacillus andaensis]MBP2003931.1 uncharacterized membrane protein YjjP (DUF1212 family) [Halobacillus andaensis]GGF14463.1 hypothetical protein GCM10010954_11350 [Halobacillus andaensis]
MNGKLPYITYWVVFSVGLLSLSFSFLIEYGIIYSGFLALLCGLFGAVLALGLRERTLVVLSTVLVFSPFLMLYFIDTIQGYLSNLL